MNWMTSAKKRMKKGRRSIDDTMRLNNPYSRSKSNVQRANLQSSILQASQEAPCVIPTKRRMSKDEIMITNFARNINQQQNSGPPALQSEVGAVDPFDKLQFSPSSPSAEHFCSSLIGKDALKKEDIIYEPTIVVGRKRDEPESHKKHENPILFFNEGTAYSEKAYDLTPASEEHPILEYTNQEEEDEHPLDLLAFLPVEPTKPSQRIRESDNQKHTTPINRIEMRGNVNFHKLTAELSLFTERS